MPDQINRPSITTSLSDRYTSSDKNIKPTGVNFIDQPNAFSKNFTTNKTPMVTDLTAKALNYSDTLGVTRERYRG